LNAQWDFYWKFYWKPHDSSISKDIIKEFEYWRNLFIFVTRKFISFLIPVKILNPISNKNFSLLAFWKRTVNANRTLMTQIDELRSSATLYASLFHEANGESNGYSGYCWSCQNREVKYLLTSFVRYEGNYRTCGFPVKRTAVYGVPLFGANCPLSNEKKLWSLAIS